MMIVSFASVMFVLGNVEAFSLTMRVVSSQNTLYFDLAHGKHSLRSRSVTRADFFSTLTTINENMNNGKSSFSDICDYES